MTTLQDGGGPDHRSRWRFPVVLTVVVLLIAALAVPIAHVGRTFTQFVRYQLRPDLEATLVTEPAPGAPIARRAPSAVWTGSEVLVWGGIPVTRNPAPGMPMVDPRSPGAPDGVGFDPATRRWRTLARSPLPAVTRNAAVWTGTELLVWGGRRADGTAAPRRGAAYDPATDRWAPIAEAPERTRVGPAALWWAGRMVVLGGMSYEPVTSPSEERSTSTVLFYTRATDRWQQVTVTGSALTAAVVGERLVIAGVYRDGRVWTSALRPDQVDELWDDVSPALPRNPGDLALVAGDGRLTLVAEYDSRGVQVERTLLASIPQQQLGRPAQAPYPPWPVIDVGSGVQAPTQAPESIGQGVAVPLPGRRLLLVTDFDTHLVDPVTGADTRVGGQSDADGLVWTGSQLFRWGAGGDTVTLETLRSGSA